MRKSSKLILVGGVLAALAIPSVASANVAVADGVGWAGKGDVQTALGGNGRTVNNSAIQSLLATDGLTFTYVTTDTYKVVNAWATGNSANPVSLDSHQVTVTTTVDVNAAVNYEARKVNGQKQWTGFNLTGFGAKNTTGELPVVSRTVQYKTFTWTDHKGVTHTTDQLPVDENGNLYTEGNHKAVLSVELIDSTGGLFVTGAGYGTFPLPNTPPVETATTA